MMSKMDPTIARSYANSVAAHVQAFGGSLPHNQSVSASKTSLVEVATSGPLAVGSGNLLSAKS
jgi:hypothetical protein